MEKRYEYIIVLQGLMILCLASKVSPSNLCSTSGLCCKHRDSKCVAQKINSNHTVDTSALPCYCDHACLRLQDCCPDFKEFCQVIDCHVSEWGPWSPCKGCSGTEERQRVILRHPLNGGSKCPHLKQTQPCSSSVLCHSIQNTSRRNENEGNRVEIVHEDSDLFDFSSSSCAETVILQASKACIKHNKKLHIGSRLCIKCTESTSCINELSPSIVRNFGIASDCHGKLMSLQRILSPDCKCSKGLFFKLVL
ncbi:unnamed protein product [Lepeophtheirus salmonis]|uniref:(salmon louse) hypothetical protein n=1 Tax=Lepeophtheirus salmonis TaxID=72036 RepID=A0A7R8CIX6_LEPSM|nr:spondin-1-like [Lepeophtheirus salmonis]CAB4058620.1 unnamed protein product [Lepeophtheirus salmonis]CAF2836554.1 unnamed protein product [Lepeophtheirus salmonis]